uniref:Cytochrome c oxidase subunit 3 n=1 Tax=Monomachus antipodalis TaxID=161211 RepID=A0A0E3G875_9HYME|nr:cytochrome c oxidase subunit III [Monomachus antipodalis]
MMKFNNPFHMVTSSPWPLLTSLNLYLICLSLLNFFFFKELDLMIFSLVSLILCLFQWWRDVIRESMFQGFHSMKVQMSIKLGMLNFIFSEILFFVSFFWCYFHLFLSPSLEIGLLCPSKGIYGFNPFSIPLTNTIILLFSGFLITLCHYMIMKGKFILSIFLIFLTLVFGLIFTYFQMMEYLYAKFTISDSIYGSVFFLLTGFHGIHVLIGSLFLFLTLCRVIIKHFSSEHNVGFELAAWYWHFVDVIWLFLYISIYWWPC